MEWTVPSMDCIVRGVAKSNTAERLSLSLPFPSPKVQVQRGNCGLLSQCPIASGLGLPPVASRGVETGLTAVQGQFQASSNKDLETCPPWSRCLLAFMLHPPLSSAIA